MEFSISNPESLSASMKLWFVSMVKSPTIYILDIQFLRSRSSWSLGEVTTTKNSKKKKKTCTHCDRTILQVLCVQSEIKEEGQSAKIFGRQSYMKQYLLVFVGISQVKKRASIHKDMTAK